MSNLREQIISVLGRYDKNYSDRGINANLSLWERNKGQLVQILRKHPNWNEDALAVVFDTTETRKFDKEITSVFANNLINVVAGTHISSRDYNKLINAIQVVIRDITIDIDTVKTVATIAEVKCSPGQKSSRVVNAICKKFGVNTCPGYNAAFANLADALNPIVISRKSVISVHPCDFLEMSNKDNSWSSCHRISNGEYMAGTLSYMNDNCSVVFYTIDSSNSKVLYKEKKRTRQMFAYDKGILLQSRLYPNTNNDEERLNYRNLVQQTIATCLGVPNLWALKRDVSTYVDTHRDSLHYRDYEYNQYNPTISFLSGMEPSCIKIGYKPMCIMCGHLIESTDTLYCDDCKEEEEYAVCDNCGVSMSEEDARYIDNGYYCENCSNYCQHCGDFFIGEVYEVYYNGVRTRGVCDYCFERHYLVCSHCNDAYRYEYLYYIHDDYYCIDCVESQFTKCVKCDAYVKVNEAERINGVCYCSECVPDIEQVSA